MTTPSAPTSSDPATSEVSEDEDGLHDLTRIWPMISSSPLTKLVRGGFIIRSPACSPNSHHQRHLIGSRDTSVGLSSSALLASDASTPLALLAPAIPYRRRHHQITRHRSSDLSTIFESLAHPATPDELATMMKKDATNIDDFISLAKFINLNTLCVNPVVVTEDLRHAFSVFVPDQNGSISAEELASVLQGIGEATTVAQCQKVIRGVN